MTFFRWFLAWWRGETSTRTVRTVTDDHDLPPDESDGEIIHTIFGDRVDEEAMLLRWVQQFGNCPDCEGFLFTEGFGHLNHLCNDCHSEFNIGPTWVQRIGERGAGRVYLYKEFPPTVGNG